MAEVIKIGFPIFLFLYTLIYFKKNKLTKSERLLLLFFFSYFSLSSNFELIYREIHQTFVLFVSVLYLFQIKDKYKYSRYPLKFFILLFSVILISAMYNGIIFSNSSIFNMINFISFSLSSLWVISELIKNDNSIISLSKYLKHVLFLSSLAILLLISVGTIRPELTFSNPNYFAFFLGISTVFVIYNDFKINSQNLIFLILLLLAIFFTGSRSILFIIIPILLFTFFKTNKPYFFIFVILGIILSFYFKDDILRIARIEDISEDVSIIQRNEIRMVVYNMFKSNPSFGIGYGEFINQYLNYLPYNVMFIDQTDEIVTHNDYLRILAELGLVGSLLFAYGLIRSFVLAIFDKKNSFFLISLLLVSLSYSFTHNNLNSFLFWVILFMPYIIKEKARLCQVL
jgi:hypothetical protein